AASHSQAAVAQPSAACHEPASALKWIMLRTGRRLRRLTRNLAACLAQPAGDGPLRRWLGVQDVVFMFHRVLPAAEYGAYYDPERAVTAECFAQLVPFLRRFFEIVAV